MYAGFPQGKLTAFHDQAAPARLGLSDTGLVRMQIVDVLGQRTEIHFSDWTRNPEFAGDTFTFTPPPGVDVVGEG